MRTTPENCTSTHTSPRLPRFGATLLTALFLGACGGASDNRGGGESTSGSGGGPDGAAGTSAPEVQRPDSLRIESVEVDTDALLIGFSAPSESVIWFSGTGGTWMKSADGGSSWSLGQVAGREESQFRDVHAFDAQSAVLLAIGEGSDSEIFRTEDGGATWTSVFVMDLAAGFLDCMDFWDGERGFAYGDAVDGELYLLTTGDGGRSWDRVDPDLLPAALDGEGGFAASGTCARAGTDGAGWVATGNGTAPRLLTTTDYGATWTASELPLAAGPGQGATSVGFSAFGMGYAVGGTIGGEGEGPRIALSADGGRSWSRGGEPAMDGPVYGGAWIPRSYALMAAGPGGLDWSTDSGLTWAQVSAENHWSVGFSSPGTGWATGPDGRITRITVITD